MCHESHVTRVSFDSGSFDEICINCGYTDIAGGGWGNLSKPCPYPVAEDHKDIEDANDEVDLDLIEQASRIYAEATGYYVPFHKGLSSESSDLIRKGIRAVLENVGII